MPRHGDNSALVARIDRLEELLRQSLSSANSEPGTLPAEVGLEPEPEPTPEQEPAADLLSPESTLLQSATTSSSVQSDASLTQTCSGIPPVGVIIRYESGHERFEPASLQWSSVIQNNSVVGGVKTSMDDDRPGSMPFSTINSDITELLELLPPTSHCEQLKNIYLNTFAPVSSPGCYVLLTFQ
jgi:hypothetical protein